MPLDPINGLSGSGYYFYIYKTESDGAKFELNANMESVKYSETGETMLNQIQKTAEIIMVFMKQDHCLLQYKLSTGEILH